MIIYYIDKHNFLCSYHYHCHLVMKTKYLSKKGSTPTFHPLHLWSRVCTVSWIDPHILNMKYWVPSTNKHSSHYLLIQGLSLNQTLTQVTGLAGWLAYGPTCLCHPTLQSQICANIPIIFYVSARDLNFGLYAYVEGTLTCPQYPAFSPHPGSKCWLCNLNPVGRSLRMLHGFCVLPNLRNLNVNNQNYLKSLNEH